MASHARRKFTECEDCGTPGVAGENLSYRGLCERCSIQRVEDGARQMITKSGPHYEQWKASMREYLDRELAG